MNSTTKHVKYPKTLHLSFSKGITTDDKVLEDNSCFEEKRVIVTEKYDREGLSLYKDYLHARSLDGANHPSRNWLKNFHSQMCHNIPEGWRVCGENLYAKHSIFYDNLRSYFYAFSIWDEDNTCLSWYDTLAWAKCLGLETVLVLYDGIWDENKIKELCNDDTREGFVVRLADDFFYDNFNKSVAKFVNPKFRDKLKENTRHWAYSEMILNKLVKKE